MMAGAADHSPRLCRVGGCSLPAKGRGMCKSHHVKWARENPDIRQVLSTERILIEAMPGTQAQLQLATGLSHPGTKEGLARLYEKGLAHISHHLPPTTAGTHWRPVWSAEPGQHDVVTPRQRRDQARKTKREIYARNQCVAVNWLGPLVGIRR